MFCKVLYNELEKVIHKQNVMKVQIIITSIILDLSNI